MKASYGKIGTHTMSTFDSRLKYGLSEERWADYQRARQLSEFHQWATGPYVLGKWYRTVAEWAAMQAEMEDAADQLDTQECAR